MDMSKAAKNAATTPVEQEQPASYEAALQELEQLVSRMESGQMPLADMLQSYQRGAYLLEHCRTRLQAVEAQIQVLEAGSLKNWAGGGE
jgi:exodeoxyribonuclease VII small subunit